MNRPLNLMFAITSMPVGGAETLLASLVNSFDRKRIAPQICCLKERGILGEELSRQIPVHCNLTRGKFDIAVLWRLQKLFRTERVDAVITVGAGDKMFWGRLAARLANVPVILSALHSTGWPDGVGRLNRWLTPLTDGFIAVARSHGEFLVEHENFPREKVFVIRNGIDTQRFAFSQKARDEWRSRLKLAKETPAVGIVAALRPEKNHRLFLDAARKTADAIPNAVFLIAGDGGLRQELEAYATKLGLVSQVHFVGNVSDTPGFLSALDLFALTSDNEASPVSIVEAMSCQRPVVATRVGSVPELVKDGETGFLTPTKDATAISRAWLAILGDPQLQANMGNSGRVFALNNASQSEMTGGYTRLLERKFTEKTGIQLGTAATLTSKLSTH
jgi:glycosyltransferase involved in cell wall biosynthesis